MDNPNQFSDPAEPILRGDPALSDENRAALWDVFHDSKNHNELAQKLQVMTVPDDTKKRLYEAKQKSMPTPAPMDKATEAITRLGSLDPQLLELAESHPQTAKLLVGAATMPEKSADAESSVESQTSGKRTAGGKKAQSTPMVQPPRPDGLDHMPPIDPKHFRVLASDGGVHDLPRENIEKARAIDPRLHVLNPD